MIPPSGAPGDGRRAAAYTISVGPDGIVDIDVRGVWTVAEVDRFFAVLVPIQITTRERWQRVYMLVTVETVQSPSVALYVRDRAVAGKLPGDRTAAVVATFLSKLQLRRVASGKDFGLFTDPASARTWLLST